ECRRVPSSNVRKRKSARDGFFQFLSRRSQDSEQSQVDDEASPPSSSPANTVKQAKAKAVLAPEIGLPTLRSQLNSADVNADPAPGTRDFLRFNSGSGMCNRLLVLLWPTNGNGRQMVVGSGAQTALGSGPGGVARNERHDVEHEFCFATHRHPTLARLEPREYTEPVVGRLGLRVGSAF
ncbi:unnamed protein product, partial [Amoebophrya sp. A25]